MDCWVTKIYISNYWLWVFAPFFFSLLGHSPNTYYVISDGSLLYYVSKNGSVLLLAIMSMLPCWSCACPRLFESHPLYIFNNLNIFSLIFSKNIIMLMSICVCVFCVVYSPLATLHENVHVARLFWTCKKWPKMGHAMLYVLHQTTLFQISYNLFMLWICNQNEVRICVRIDVWLICGFHSGTKPPIRIVRGMDATERSNLNLHLILVLKHAWKAKFVMNREDVGVAVGSRWLVRQRHLKPNWMMDWQALFQFISFTEWYDMEIKKAIFSLL